MILAALLIGCIAAYYFGLRTGATCAAVAFGLFFIADLIPGIVLPVYIAVALGIIALYVIGPRRQDREAALRLRNGGRKLLLRLYRLIWRHG